MTMAHQSNQHKAAQSTRMRSGSVSKLSRAQRELARARQLGPHSLSEKEFLAGIEKTGTLRARTVS